MADVRCPMCGKSNPADAETCQFCSARIKPLIIPPDPGGDAGIPDWLRDLRGKDSGEPSRGADPFGSGSQPDASGSGTDNPFTGGIDTPQDDADVPDWLARIRERSRDGEESAPAEQDSGWLDSLRPGDDSLPEAGETFAADDTAGQPFGSDLVGDFTSDEPETGAAANDAVPDWLAQLGSETSSDATSLESTSTGDSEDWLSGVQGTSFESGGEEPPAQQNEDSALPGWLSQIGGGTPDEAQPESTAAPSDFQFDFQETPAAGETRFTPGEETPAGGDQEALPDWLSGFSQQETPAADSGESDNAVPNWLTGSVEPETTPAETGEQDFYIEPTRADDLPAWLQGDQIPPVEASADSETPSGEQFQADLPAWMTTDATGGDQAAPGETAETGETGESGQTAWGESIPAWINDIQPEEQLSQAQPFDELSAAGFGAELPGEGEEEAIPAEQQDVPDWLSRLSDQTESGGAPPAGDIFTRQPIETRSPQAEESMPNWLARMGPPEENQPVRGDETAASHEEEISLAPGELPNWVQAMRPIESATLETPINTEVDERVERAGPLAGLKGIIPSEPLASGLRKPPVYSVKLHTSEKQRADIALLESVVASESQPEALPVASPVTSKSLLRWAIALVLILAVAVPLWLQTNLLVTPGVVSPELIALNRAVSVLPEGSTVLLAVEYEPGLAGEMEAAASSLVTHLMTRSANIVLFSTNPTGPVLGERLLDHAHRIQPGLIGGGSANLGYLPGGPAALLNFALDPRGTTGSSKRLDAVWSQPYMQAITTAADFSAVILVTENADTARSWIEQVAPTLDTKQAPMYVVSSAQSAPMISPYVDSGQFKGMLVGLAGGASYEQLRQYPATASAYWDAYQIGILVLITLILLGGLYALGTELVKQSRQNSGDA